MISKNICKIIISMSLVTLCFLNISGCRSLLSNITNENTNESDEVVIDIQTKVFEWANKNKDKNICYYSFNINEEANETEAFTPDEMEVFTARYGCFNSYSSLKPRGIDNPIDFIQLTDEAGNDVEITPIITSIFDEAQTIEHPIIDMKIFKDNEEYFVFVTLNVNWWTPCVLYYYNQEYSKLIELYTFANEEIIGIKIHDLSLYK